MQNKRYDYHNVQGTPGLKFKYAMAATIGLIFLHFGFIGESIGDFLWIITTTGLATYVWFSFRRYFTTVNDHQTAKWIWGIVAVIVLHGVVNLLFYLTTGVLDLHANDFALNTVKYLFYLVLLSLTILIAVCIKIITVNGHHSFGLKRIALSALVCIPAYFLVSSVKNIRFIWQAREAMDIVFERGQGGYLDPQFGLDMFSGVFFFFSLLWTIFIMLPYFFLFFHFMKADR